MLIAMEVTHTMRHKLWMLMKQNDVEVICLPPHSTHWLQPADKSLFKSLKSQCRKKMGWVVATGGGCRVTKEMVLFCSLLQFGNSVWV